MSKLSPTLSSLGFVRSVRNRGPGVLRPGSQWEAPCLETLGQALCAPCPHEGGVGRGKNWEARNKQERHPVCLASMKPDAQEQKQPRREHSPSPRFWDRFAKAPPRFPFF